LERLVGPPLHRLKPLKTARNWRSLARPSGRS